MAFSRFYITNNGLAYLARAQAGKRLAVTRGAFGSGGKPPETAPFDMTALVNPLGALPIAEKRTNGATATITTQFSNQTAGGGLLPPFHMMEACLFAKLVQEDGSDDPTNAEILFAYAYASNQEEADYIPQVLTEYVMNWPLTHSNASAVDVVIDYSLVYPTKEEFNAAMDIRAVSGGTGAALTITTPDGVVVSDGTTVTVKLTSDIQENATLSTNGGPAYPIYTSDGKPVKEGIAKAGSYLPMAFNETEKRWYLTGGGGISKEDKAKLDGIEAGANKYIHPTTHPVEMITGLGNAATKDVGAGSNQVAAGDHNHDEKYAQKSHNHAPGDVKQDANNRFVTDSEKAAWTAKQAALTFDTAPAANSGNPVTSGGIKTALDGKAAASHTHTKEQVGLGNVDNTSDANKPISTATQTALNGKVPTARKVNNKALSKDITLAATDVGAVPTTGGTMTGALIMGDMRISWNATAKALDFEVVT